MGNDAMNMQTRDASTSLVREFVYTTDYVDLQQARGLTGGPVGAAYMFGKSGASVGKAIGGRKSGYMVPFTDPGELTALRYAREGRGFGDVFTPAYMENACP